MNFVIGVAINILRTLRKTSKQNGNKVTLNYRFYDRLTFLLITAVKLVDVALIRRGKAAAMRRSART